MIGRPELPKRYIPRLVWAPSTWPGRRPPTLQLAYTQRSSPSPPLRSADPSPAQISRTRCRCTGSCRGADVEHGQRLDAVWGRVVLGPASTTLPVFRGGTSEQVWLGRFCQRICRRCRQAHPSPTDATHSVLNSSHVPSSSGLRRPRRPPSARPRLAGRRMRSSRSPKQKVRRDASAAPKRNQRGAADANAFEGR